MQLGNVGHISEVSSSLVLHISFHLEWWLFFGCVKIVVSCPCLPEFLVHYKSKYLKCFSKAMEKSHLVDCRAPLDCKQTDSWECFCVIEWDPLHADCAIPQVSYLVSANCSCYILQCFTCVHTWRNFACRLKVLKFLKQNLLHSILHSLPHFIFKTNTKF